MSSPESRGGDERNLTIIVVPHGDLETRNFVISYGTLKVIVIATVVMMLAFAVALAVLFPIIIQASKVGSLQEDLAELEGERARVAELAKTLQEVEAQYERVRQLLGADAAVGGDSVPLLPPLRSDTTTSNDGAPETTAVDLWPLTTPGYITRALSDGRSEHPGLDIAVPRNSYVRAAGAGWVRVAGVDDVYGNYVVLSHGNGVETVYGHASKVLVTPGGRVRRGEVIALSGSSGRSTAPHLHFEVRQNGRAVDPLTFVRQP